MRVFIAVHVSVMLGHATGAAPQNTNIGPAIAETYAVWGQCFTLHECTLHDLSMEPSYGVIVILQSRGFFCIPFRPPGCTSFCCTLLSLRLFCWVASQSHWCSKDADVAKVFFFFNGEHWLGTETFCCVMIHNRVCATICYTVVLYLKCKLNG